MLERVPLPEGMLGGVPKKSIKDNAKRHVGQRSVITLDLKKCFHNISDVTVFQVFLEAVGCCPTTAAVLTRLTTLDNKLPQGAPTSPAIANISLLPMYNDMQDLAKRMGLTCTFWVDDIVFSGMHAPNAVEEAKLIIRRHGHAFERNKVKVMPRSKGPQMVPGAIVNNCVSINRATREAIRERLHMLWMIGEVSEFELRSLRGHIAQIKYMNEAQGLALERYALQCIPLKVVPGDNPNPERTGPCDCSRRKRKPRSNKDKWATRAPGRLGNALKRSKGQAPLLPQP